MQTSDKRAIAADLGEKLLHLYVLRSQACGQEDWHRVRTLETEIKQATAARNAVLFERMAKTA
jgi:hypothetical protein